MTGGAVFICIDSDTDTPRLVVKTANAEQTSLMEYTMTDTMRDFGATSSREVCAWAIGPEYEAFLKSGKIPAPITPSQVFPNALAASRAMGLKGNQVSNILTHNRRDHSVSTEIRGVEWRYAREVLGD